MKKDARNPLNNVAYNKKLANLLCVCIKVTQPISYRQILRNIEVYPYDIRIQNCLEVSILDEIKEVKRGKISVYFFKDGRCATPDELTKVYNFYDLVPDPCAQALAIKESINLPRIFPNCCQWQDSSGELCYARFYQTFVGFSGIINYVYKDFEADQYFCGVRK